MLLATIVMTLIVAGCGGPSDAASNEGDFQSRRRAGRRPEISESAVSLYSPPAPTWAFEVPGEVGAVNVAVGDAVSAGDVLAALETETLSQLEHAVAQAAFDLDAAQDQLDAVLGLESDDPLVRARAENALAQAESALAQAEVNLDNAQERLDDFQLQYDVSLGDARRAVADATAGLDRAEETLSDFAAEHSERFAQALESPRTGQGCPWTPPRRSRDDFLPDYDEALTRLRNDISTTEQDLDQAREALRDFDINHADRLATARQALAQAEFDLGRRGRGFLPLFTYGSSKTVSGRLPTAKTLTWCNWMPCSPPSALPSGRWKPGPRRWPTLKPAPNNLIVTRPPTWSASWKTGSPA